MMVLLDHSEVAFDDEIAESFYYDSKAKVLEIGFERFIQNGEFHELACIIRVTNWKSAQSRRYENQKFQDLESSLGVVALLLSVELVGKILVILVNTTDNRHVEWHFESASLEVVIESKERN
jgi:hypothetical protein